MSVALNCKKCVMSGVSLSVFLTVLFAVLPAIGGVPQTMRRQRLAFWAPWKIPKGEQLPMLALRSCR
jgi:hypothetical protein